MKINRDNYEAYFIDYLEGNLDELLVNDFIEFLQNNPDLKEELSLFEPVTVEPEGIAFNKKDDLLKQRLDSEEEFNRAAIANLEGDITDKEKQELDNYLSKHPEKKRDLLLFSKTKLHADESIVFEKKRRLYHNSLGKTILLWSGRVAAIIVLAFAFFTLFDKPANNVIPEETVVALEDKVKKTTNLEEKVIPVEEKKEEPKKVPKVTPKPETKKAKPQDKPSKSLRESTEGRLSHEDIAMLRIPIEVPSELAGITASLNIEQPKTYLAKMNRVAPENSLDYNEERLLADVIKEKTGLNKFRFNKITKAGLSLVSNISNDKFKYETNEEGKVTEYNYESRLLAFSIPSKNAGSR